MAVPAFFWEKTTFARLRRSVKTGRNRSKSLKTTRKKEPDQAPFSCLRRSEGYFEDSFLLDPLPEVAARRSAQRRFIASAIRLRPSGDKFRCRFVEVEALLVLPLGLPRRGATVPLAAIPVRALRACCRREISASISEIIRLTSMMFPLPTLDLDKVRSESYGLVNESPRKLYDVYRPAANYARPFVIFYVVLVQLIYIRCKRSVIVRLN